MQSGQLEIQKQKIMKDAEMKNIIYKLLINHNFTE